jgi:hypothetical protein
VVQGDGDGDGDSDGAHVGTSSSFEDPTQNLTPLLEQQQAETGNS